MRESRLRRLLYVVGALTVAWGLSGCAVLDWYPDGKIPEPCGAAHRATLAACKVESEACAAAKAVESEACGAPQTTPTKGQEGDGKPAPAPEPPPGPLTCANKDCVPGHRCVDTPAGPQCVQPEPPAATCPLPDLAEGRSVWVDAKHYGQGVDSEPRTDDPAICKAIHGQDWQGSSCHFESPSLSPELRSICERHYLGGCPTWQYRLAGGPWRQCAQAPAEMSCDHFGTAGQALDDPQTPPFEGMPAECGVQRSADGLPMAGPFVIAHGLGEVRACSATPGKGCGRCRTPMADGCAVNH
jgi:hypothetical protein